MLGAGFTPALLAPKSFLAPFRSLLFGSTHSEIDLVGSHYQLFQRLSFLYLGVILPSVRDLRTLIRNNVNTLPPPLLFPYSCPQRSPARARGDSERFGILGGRFGFEHHAEFLKESEVVLLCARTVGHHLFETVCPTAF